MVVAYYCKAACNDITQVLLYIVNVFVQCFENRLAYFAMDAR
jgi:hypothetical protein